MCVCVPVVNRSVIRLLKIKLQAHGFIRLYICILHVCVYVCIRRMYKSIVSVPGFSICTTFRSTLTTIGSTVNTAIWHLFVRGSLFRYVKRSRLRRTLLLLLHNY